PTRGGHPRVRSTVASLQGPADSWQPARGYRPRPALPPAGVATSVAGVAAPWLRRGSDDGSAVRVKEG
ncbi:hypothetical protein GW17_00047405, partial [Ensete ventricosum]